MTKKLSRIVALMLAVIMSFSMLLVPVEASVFEDVSDHAWYGDAVNYVQQRGWMAGVSSTQFSPNAKLTRGMFVTVLSRFAEAETENLSPAFKDTRAGNYYTNAAAWAAENGIVSGVGGNNFYPSGKISRQDLCVMLYRFMQYMEYDFDALYETEFNDFSSISAYAQEAVKYCASVGLVAGYSDGSFHPKATATRAQAAVILTALSIKLQGDIVKPEPMPAQSFEDTVDSLKVNVDAPEGALPEDSTMQLTKIDDAQELEILSFHLQGQVLAAVDISFLKDSNEREPEKNVAVQFTMEGLENATNPIVVHITDTGKIEYVSNVQISDAAEGVQALNFQAKDFSVYAVVDANDVVKVRFFKTDADAAAETNVLSEQLIGNNAGTVGQAIDPPVELTEFENFVEWKILNKDVHGDIAVINEYIAAHYNESATKDLRVVAVLKNVRYLVYYDDNEVRRVLKTAAALYDEGDDCTTTVDFDFVPVAGDEEFKCWNTKEDGTGVDYDNGDSITLTANYTNLYPVNEKGVWLSFDNNIGQDTDPTTGSFTSPVFYTNTKPTEQPADPTRTGYTFAGWFKDAAMTQEFTFGGTISEDTRIFAKWNKANADYTVVFWVQKSTDSVDASDQEKEYDYLDSVVRSGETWGTASIEDSDKTRGNVKGSELGYYYLYNDNNSDTEGATIYGDGSTVLNVYYDRRVITYNYHNTVSYTQRQNQTTYNINNQYFYRLDNSTYFPMWLKSTNANYPDADGNIPGQYCTFGYWHYEEGWFNTTNEARSVGRNDSHIYQLTSAVTYEKKGLYGSVIPGSDVPSAGSNYIWHFGGKDTDNNIDYAAEFYSDVFNTYIISNADDRAVLHLWREAYSQSGTLKNIHDIGQDLNGDYTITLHDSKIQSGEIAFYTGDEYYGFKLVRYNRNSNNFNNATPWSYNGDYLELGYSNLNNNTYLYYQRNQNNLVYRSNNSNVKTESVYYEKPLSEYASYVPTNGPAGYYFDGWYADPGFGTEFDFSDEMPNANVTIYAKWTMMRFRVVLDPTGGDDSVQPSDVTFPGNQATTFRLDYGEEIQKSSIQAAERDGYTLTGWFYDEAHTRQFSFSFSDWESVADMTYADASADERQGIDPWNLDDNNQPVAYSDVDRPNVVGKVVLYANWRKNMGDNSYLKVRYDAGDGTFSGGESIRLDTLNYADGAEAVAQPASAAPAGQEFVEWKIMKPTSSTDSTLVETGLTARPGDAFSVLMDNAVKEGEYYIVTLKATYYALTYTHITWVGNGGTMADGSTQKESESVPLNTLLPIEPGDLFVNPGRTFLGWARFAETECDKDDNGIWQPKDNANANLWLEYHKAEGTTPAYFTEKTQSDRTVKYVAADETQPYQILYAVWSEPNTYYVYHSATGKLEARKIGTNVNLKDLVTSGHYYGGYYKDTGAVNQASVKKAIGVASLASTQVAGVEEAKLYTGLPLVSEGTRFWKRGEAETTNGTNLTPTAGHVYYLKEVPETYLTTKYIYTYEANHGNVIQEFFMLTLVDDGYYDTIGFRQVKDATTEEAAAGGSLDARQTMARKIVITEQDGTSEITVTAANFGKAAGYVAVRQDNTQIQANNSFSVMPAWKTLDGVEVNSRGALKLTVNSDKTAITYGPLTPNTILADNKLYVSVDNVKSWWYNDGGFTKVHFYGGGEDPVTITPVAVEGKDDFFVCDLPEGNYTAFKVMRATKNNDVVTDWVNETVEINIDRSKNLIWVKDNNGSGPCPIHYENYNP